MRKAGLPVILLWLAFWCVSSLPLDPPVYAEKIPGLSEVPADLPLDVRVQFGQRRQALEKDLADFQAAAAAFNAKEAKDQGEAEYQALDAWRTRYISAAKAFNQEVAEAGRVGLPLKPTPYTVGVGSVRGEVFIENSDGSRQTSANLAAGRVVRVDTGTRVTTGPTGRLQILLLDETVFTIGPNCDMVIDEFVYDPDPSARKISVNITKGIFRWVTGKTAPKDPARMKVKTPGVAGGLRGTDFETFVETDGSGYIKLFSGELEITPLKGGSPFVMEEKSMVTFRADGAVGLPEPIR